MYQPLAFIIVTEDALAKLFTSWLEECKINAEVFNSLSSAAEYYVQQPGVMLVDLKLINKDTQRIINAFQDSGIPIILLAQYSNYDIVIKNKYFEMCQLPVEKDRFNLIFSNALKYYEMIQKNRMIQEELNQQNEEKRFLTRNNLVIEILNNCNHLSRDEILIILGEKGIGKSTLIDYIITKNNFHNHKIIKIIFQNEIELLDKLMHIKNAKSFGDNKLILEITTPYPEWNNWDSKIKKNHYFGNSEIFTIPPLRERFEDIKYYLSKFISRINSMGIKNIIGVSKEAEFMLSKHQWHENLYEFYDTIKKAVEISNTGYIEATDIAMVLKENKTVNSGDSIIINDVIPMEDYKMKIVKFAYKKCDGNILEAANKLKLGRATVYRLLHKYDII